MIKYKYAKNFPYNDECGGNHIFIKSLDVQICRRCNWVKHKIEIDAEREYVEKLERYSKRLMIKNEHIELFHF